MSDITVVIVTYNRAVLLTRVLLKLLEQHLRPQIILCDDGGDLGALPADLIDACVSKYIWTKHSRYQRVARFNEGMAAVTTPKAILLDDDQLPSYPTFTEDYSAQLEEAPIVRGLGIDATNACRMPTWFSTANLGIRTHVWKTIGGFDPAYNGNYGYEDHDLGKRIEVANLTVVPGLEGTCCGHLGLPYSGDRDSQEVNQRYYYQKWGRD